MSVKICESCGQPVKPTMLEFAEWWQANALRALELEREMKLARGWQEMGPPRKPWSKLRAPKDAAE